jgi:hypothetical protein
VVAVHNQNEVPTTPVPGNVDSPICNILGNGLLIEVSTNLSLLQLGSFQNPSLIECVALGFLFNHVAQIVNLLSLGILPLS